MSDELAQRLRKEGYRLTPQRQFVLRAVEKLGHATPDEVYAEVRTHSTAVNISNVSNVSKGQQHAHTTL